MAFLHAVLVAYAKGRAHAVATGIGDLKPMADPQGVIADAVAGQPYHGHDTVYRVLGKDSRNTRV